MVIDIKERLFKLSFTNKRGKYENKNLHTSCCFVVGV